MKHTNPMDSKDRGLGRRRPSSTWAKWLVLTLPLLLAPLCFSQIVSPGPESGGDGEGATMPEDLALRDLFPTTGAETTRETDPTLDKLLVRKRPVTVDFSLLDAARADELDAIHFNLFEDVIVEGAVRRKIVRSPERYSLIGSIIGKGYSHFIVTVRDGSMVGRVTTPDGRLFVIGGIGGKGALVQEWDPSLVGQCGADLDSSPVSDSEGPSSAEAGQMPSYTPTPLPRGAVPVSANLSPCNSGTPRPIHILVVYTQAAATEAENGMSSDIETVIDNSIDDYNDVLTTTGITDLELVLAADAAAVNYTEESPTPNALTDLYRLRWRSDGYMDSVHELREQYSADLVSLFVNWPSGYGVGGVAGVPIRWSSDDSFDQTHWYETSQPAEKTMSILDVNATVGTHSFAHELGHNFGLHHQVYGFAEAGGGTPIPSPTPVYRLYDYGFAYVWWVPAQPTPTPSMYGSTRGTLMATFNEVGVRLARYSDPDATPFPFGDPDYANAKLVIRKLDSVISNWRPDPDSIMTLSRATRGEARERVFSIDKNGNFVIESSLTENATTQQLTAASGDLWLQYATDGASVVARVEADGDMYIDGSITTGLSIPLTLTNEVFVWRNASSQAVAYVDNSGNLKLGGSACTWQDSYGPN